MVDNKMMETEEDRRRRLSDTGKKVAQLLAENQVTFAEVSRVFREAEFHMTVSYRGERA